MLSLEESGCADETSRGRVVSRVRLVSEAINFFSYICLPEFSVKKSGTNFDFH